MTFPTIHPIAFWQEAKKYRLNTLRYDLFSAFCVALMALPQAMAYAILAGLPPSTGIWSVVFGTMFTAAFGCSRVVVSGTTNMIAILIQSGTAEILYTYYRGFSGLEQDALALNIVLQLVLMIGIFQILAAFLRLGRLTQFISRSVVTGYIAGAALAIVISQLFLFFGIPKLGGYQSVYQQGWYLFSHLYALHWTTTCFSIGSLLLLILLPKLFHKIPSALIVFILAGVAVFVFNLAPQEHKGVFDTPPGQKIEKVTLVEEIGSIEPDLPTVVFPVFQIRIFGKLLPLALAITLLSTLEITSIGRTYTRAKDPPYHDNQEIYGLGVSNVLCAFLGAMPGSGSFTRSALNASKGAKTRFSAIFSGAIVWIFVLVLGAFVAKIPLATISALMLLTAYSMVNFRHFFMCLKITRADAFVVIMTLISTWFFTLDVALYIGIGLSVVLYLKQAAIPYLVEYTFNNYGKLRPLDIEDERPDPRICIFQAEGELFFAAAEPLQTKLHQISEDENLKVIILQLLNTRSIDASVCLAIEHICEHLHMEQRHFMLTGICPEMWRTLKQADLIARIGEKNCFSANEQLPSEPTRDAYASAKKILESV